MRYCITEDIVWLIGGEEFLWNRVLYGNSSTLLMFNAGHKSCDVPLCIELERLHF